MKDSDKKETIGEDSSSQEKMAIKYCFLRDKIFFHFRRGRKILKISKIVAAVIFLLYTIIGVIVSSRTSSELQFLTKWILLIFLDVAVFVIADYCKYLVENKVIPYLLNDEQIEFGEYDIFLEENDEEEETEE
ncbi:MAG: hypothetical protein IKN26_07360 [Eubacterium sp.]|nr:hypothetical protein [Eubacterium sp.]MBR4242092.1 hypothetical protein [Eubacterium sp.]MBR7061072.1 hypothetical protein [Eubacterium sp.]